MPSALVVLMAGEMSQVMVGVVAPLAYPVAFAYVFPRLQSAPVSVFTVKPSLRLALV